MRRKDKLVTDIKILHEVINKAEVCRLGLVDGLKPYIVPLSFGFNGTHIYFHSATEGRKVDILRKNKQVCVEFEQDVVLLKGKKACNYGFRYLTVICHGTAEVVHEAEEKRYALNQLMKHYNPEWASYSFTEQELASVLVFKITIEEMTGKVSGVTL
jgi:nitroimidazol reductase NimA-like FMN-containing flavoprotein (pyridoxamine 5'-phosphate oxidase superfamily)